MCHSYFPTTLVDMAHAPYEKKQRRVTFQEAVMQHYCSVENIGKPFFEEARKAASLKLGPPDVSYPTSK